MNKYYLITFLFFFSIAFANAQEREYELSGNPLLMVKHRTPSDSKINSLNKKIIVFVKDTLSISIPFLDDFSTNKFTSYDTSDYDQNAFTSGVRYSFKVNGSIVNTVDYDTTVSYTYIYDTNIHQLIGTPTVPFIIDFYDAVSTPNVITKTINAWIPNIIPVYDTIADTLKYYLHQPFITSNLEIDSITFVDTHTRPALWYENEVFVNSTLPLKPPTIGVATFDGLDSTGYPYNKFIDPVGYGKADKLTSKYINLGSPINPNDRVDLSFFYQPQGRGNSPESTDSLVLEFKAPGDAWQHVWSHEGTILPTDSSFTQVTIPLKNTPYMYNGFQFRFRNYATLSGNLDHWHIDYVKIKKIINLQDTVVRDVAFVYPPEPFLTDYYAVPFHQFAPSMLRSTIHNTINNLNITTENLASYHYRIKDNDNNLITTYNSGPSNIRSYTLGFHDFTPHVNPPANGFGMADTLFRCRDFIVEHDVELAGVTGTDQINSNDTVRFTQRFTDYFAYDDGSAESAYGVVQAHGQVGYKFTLTNPDTLRSVLIYFNPVIENGTNKVFKLTVWADNAGQPGSVIYQNDTNYVPAYAHYIDGFIEYKFDSLLLLSGTFYVGWEQSTANELNVGLDKSSDHSDRVFYNIGSGWFQSIRKGNLMMRPVFGSCPFLYIGIAEQNNLPKSSLEIYPNPAHDKLFLKTEKSFDANITLYDLTGKIIFTRQQSTSESIDVSSISEGIYFLRVENKLLHAFVNKKVVIMK